MKQSQQTQPGSLSGVRVLDLATMLAGPYGATVLGDLGADVIKVESHYGDDTRHLGPERDGERSPFLCINRNKRSLVLDLRRDDAQEVFAKLVASADVVITNVREPAMSKLGMNYEQLRKHRDDIIWVGVTAFGADGPYAGRPGIDFLAQGFAGLLALNGEPEQPPVRVTVPVVDTMTSLLVVSGVLAALRVRDSSGKGQRIDVSLLDALVHAQCTGLGSYFLGEDPPRMGNRSQYLCPSGVYTCRDGKSLCLTCPSDKFFVNMSKAFETDWDDDPRFRTMKMRLENEEALDRKIADRCKDFDRDDLTQRLVAADVLTAPVNEMSEVVEDPQILHNEMIVTTEHAKLGATRVTGVPLKLSETPGSVRRSPPVHGQHSKEVMTELGYDSAAIEQLLRSKALGTWPKKQENEEE